MYHTNEEIARQELILLLISIYGSVDKIGVAKALLLVPITRMPFVLLRVLTDPLSII